MKKFLFVVLCFVLIIPVFAEEYNFTQADIDKFLSFAPAYLTMARTYFPDNTAMELEDFYYSDNDKLMDATENFLKPYNWAYLKLNDFIYITRITLDYIALMDAYILFSAEEASLFSEDITDTMLTLITDNMDKLDDFFHITDYSDDDTETPAADAED